jgi:GH24 family phage-related lysozyme (muramidase)|tara:strand:+ start:138 stop:797 length:660 start_codon:yes stop_codon:yes gene_type:complete
MILHEDKAVAHVAGMLGRDLTPMEERVVRLEGFATEAYTDDSKEKVPTIGVGQTGEWMDKSFPEALEHHVNLTRRMIPEFDNLSPELQIELVQATYRGDLGQGIDTRALINAGDFTGAAKEFLNNDNYREESTSQQIQDRMYAVNQALLREGEFGQYAPEFEMLDNYTAIKDDNPYSIAKAHGLSLPELANINLDVKDSLMNGNVNEGQRLNVRYASVL